MKKTILILTLTCILNLVEYSALQAKTELGLSFAVGQFLFLYSETDKLYFGESGYFNSATQRASFSINVEFIGKENLKEIIRKRSNVELGINFWKFFVTEARFKYWEETKGDTTLNREQLSLGIGMIAGKYNESSFVQAVGVAGRSYYGIIRDSEYLIGIDIKSRLNLPLFLSMRVDFSGSYRHFQKSKKHWLELNTGLAIPIGKNFAVRIGALRVNENKVTIMSYSVGVLGVF